MKWVTIAARVLLGLAFTAAGIAFFLMTPPELPPGPMADFTKGLAASGYFFYLLKVTEITCGLLLLSGYFVPLALVVLAPVVLNIFLVHAVLTPPSELVAPTVLGALLVYLAFFSKEYSPTVKHLFKPKP